MKIEAKNGGLSVWPGTSFNVDDVNRLDEAVSAFGPLSHLTFDCSKVHDLDPWVLVTLAHRLSKLPKGTVSMKGLAQHHRRLLEYLGFPAGNTAT